MYQIYPRSFCDTKGSGVGDLKGVAEKLDYVASLGVDGVWLSPFFTSPMQDFGYDVSNYRDVDPLFGELADFDAVVAKAHALGLKIIIDQVYSHTSDQHAWFNESRQSREGDKADWYVWADPKPDGSPPNNWQSIFGGMAWTWDARRRQYYMHSFLNSQPDLNVQNPKVQDALLDVGRFWLDRGVDGFRLDVANHYMHDPLLRDNPSAYNPDARIPYRMQRHVYDKSRPENIAFIKRLRALTDSYHDRMMVAEIEDEDSIACTLNYTNAPDRLHTAYNFLYLWNNEPLKASTVHAVEQTWQQRASSAWPSWAFSNHDVPRVASRFAHGEPSADQSQLFLAILLALRGTIFLYQGEELGLPDADVPPERIVDPEAHRNGPASLGRDGCRTPLPWSDEAPMGGFSAAADAWLPMDPAHLPLSISAQEKNAFSTLARARALIALRQAQPALRSGSIRTAVIADAILVIERRPRWDNSQPATPGAGMPPAGVPEADARLEALSADKAVVGVFNVSPLAQQYRHEQLLDEPLLASHGVQMVNANDVQLAPFSWAYWGIDGHP